MTASPQSALPGVAPQHVFEEAEVQQHRDEFRGPAPQDPQRRTVGVGGKQQAQAECDERRSDDREIDGSGHESTTEGRGGRDRRCVWLECCGELLVVCEPVLRFFCETTHNDRAQTLRDRPVERVGRGRRIVRHRHQHRHQVRRDKGSAAGEQLEQRGAYAVDVAARVERGAVKLLRRGIGWGPDDMSDPGELRRVRQDAPIAKSRNRRS